MKTKSIILLGIAAIITLSFSFVSVTTTPKAGVKQATQQTVSEPAGGFALEDKL